MAGTLNFDANTVPPQSPFTPVPNGEYRAMIVESEVKATKDTLGKYLQLVWQILDGPEKGRKLWDRLNIVNNNATAQQIGQQQLSAVCHATGVLKLTSSAQLHAIPCVLKVVVKQSPGYEPANEVKGYKSGGAGVTAGALVPAAGPSTTAAPAANAPAWAKQKAS